MAPIEWHPGFLAALNADEGLRRGNPPISSIDEHVEKMSDHKALRRIIAAHSALRPPGKGSDSCPKGRHPSGGKER